MSSKFFNNDSGNTLFEKLKGIAGNMANFDRFLAVVGFFRSSGYFKLRKELNDVEEIKILVGINIDDIFRRHNKAMLMLENEEKAKMVYDEEFRQDIVNARYAPEVEEGILQMCQDLVDGRLQMKIHATKNLHAKFYLCLPNNHNENTDGWVIMGSSNISDSGLGTTQSPRYELNVAMKDFDDVDYCHTEFKKLWEEAVPLTIDDIESIKQKTYLGYQPTPYEIYLKVLIDTFGEQVEDDFSVQLPPGVMELKYQTDAVIQGFQMLMRHKGLFLADVVGLGKTMNATMIAKRFIEANGRNTSILVVFPPALRDNWENTFKQFGIYNKAQFITNGKLDRVLDGKDRYKAKEEFELRREQELEKARIEAQSIVSRVQRESQALVEELEKVRKEKESSDFSKLVLEAKQKQRSSMNKLYLEANPVISKDDDSYELPRPLKKGDNIIIAESGRKGIIINPPDAKGMCFVQVGVMKTKLDVKKLRLVEKQKDTKQPKKRGSVSTKGVESRMTRRVSTELDIRGYASDDGIYEVDNFIDSAIMSGVGLVTIIHGKGTGVLKNAIRAHLKRHPQVKSARPGLYGEGEDGVTIVELKK